MELQNGLDWKGLEDHLAPIPCHGQGCHSPVQAAQNPIQPGLKHLQGWGTHSFSGQPVPKHGFWGRAPIAPNIQLATPVRGKSNHFRNNCSSRMPVPVGLDGTLSYSRCKMCASSLLWKRAHIDGFCKASQMTTFQFFWAKKWINFRGTWLFPPKENKISSALLKKKWPTLIQAKHTLTCKSRNGKSLQEIANSFQVFPLFTFTGSGFLLGKITSFLNAPERWFSSYKRSFRKVPCCYLF